MRKALERSARVAWEGRPRGTEDGLVELIVVDGEGRKEARRVFPPWGIISHPGWSSPDSKDLPNLHLPPIVLELPHLIEAKAVSLVPATSQSSASALGLENTVNEEALVPSPSAISLLQRPAAMNLRDYLAHLSSLGLINPPDLAPTFLSMYEEARFSASEITEQDFRALMSVFADLLRGMETLDAGIVGDLQAGEEGEENITWEAQARDYDGAQGGEDNQPRSSLETTSTVAHTPMPAPYASSLSSAGASSQHSLRTAPSAQRSQQAVDSPEGSVVQRRGLRTPSIATLKSLRSRASSVLTGGSAGGGSVIHVAEAAGELNLPIAENGGG